MKEEKEIKQEEVRKLKPVTFIKGEYNYSRQNDFQQKLLLKAMQVTSDPQELRKMAGLKTVADVYRTLDKLAIRKEYHEALLRKGIDLDTIIGGIKGIAENSTKDSTRLKAYHIFLKSLGLDEYKESPDEAKQSWEDLLNDVVSKEEVKPKEIEADYEVIIPETPEEEKRKREEEDKIGKSIYE
jgi:hypothetical protein